MDHLQRLAMGSILVGVAVLGLKYLAYHLTGSVALYSDALESIVNVVTAVAALIAVRASARPADAGHPYRHHKAEYLSTVLEGVLIAVAALSILREAIGSLMAPTPLLAPVEGLLVNGLASAINGAWGAVLIRQGRKHRSPALVGDGQHLLTDVITSAGVLVGVVLVTVTGWLVIDAVVAMLVALHILHAGWKMLRSSVGGLMDEAMPPDQQALIAQRVREHAGPAIEAHDLRTRHAGRRSFIEFHLVVPGELTVAAAHDICDRIERSLLADFGDAVITIHVEPAHEARQTGIVMRLDPGHSGTGSSTP
jgi:cation diffusion facilitator family transporter